MNTFLKLAKKLAEEISDNDFGPLHYVTPVSNSFTFQTISEEDIYRISSLKTCKSAGIDKISVKLIQAAGRTILNPLKIIFNLSILAYSLMIGKPLVLHQYLSLIIKQTVVIIDQFP